MILDEVERPEEGREEWGEGGNLGNRSTRKGGSDFKCSQIPLYYWAGKKNRLPSVVWRFWYLLFLCQDIEVMRADLGISRVHLPFGFGLLSFPEYFYLFYQRT